MSDTPMHHLTHPSQKYWRKDPVPSLIHICVPQLWPRIYVVTHQAVVMFCGWEGNCRNYWQPAPGL